jgi:hypothetical protein
LIPARFDYGWESTTKTAKPLQALVGWSLLGAELVHVPWGTIKRRDEGRLGGGNIGNRSREVYDMNLQERVERLERENCRMKRFGFTLIAIAMLAGVAMGAARKNYTAFDWVSAYGFTLRDSRARDRGGLLYDPSIGPYFCLKDEDGNIKVRITTDKLDHN